MARIRSIKPSIWTDDKFIRLSRDARLLCLGLISNADDDGRFIASGASIAGVVFPHDDLSTRMVEKWRDEIVATGLIVLYHQGHGTYGHFPKWTTHQMIRKHMKSGLPEPPKPVSALPGTSPSAAPGASLGAEVRTA